MTSLTGYKYSVNKHYDTVNIFRHFHCSFNHDDAYSETTGSEMGSRESTWKWPIGHQELIWRQTVKTNVHMLVKVICTSWRNAVNTLNIFTAEHRSVTSQQIQNCLALARTVVKAPKFSHITPILRSLHCTLAQDSLPVLSTIDYYNFLHYNLPNAYVLPLYAIYSSSNTKQLAWFFPDRCTFPGRRYQTWNKLLLLLFSSPTPLLPL